MWADHYADEKKRAEMRDQIEKHTKLKDFSKSISVKFLSDDTAGILFYDNGVDDLDPVALLSVDWADICLRITYVQW